ncbi:hypothetical protein GGE46_001797 [Rhizobium etli]|uniref:Uncharacterized protein n=1 Tax=Rhizobium etli TaxID=29449 RepID=A0A7W6Y6M1_RHIET|nr:hypothetical protein [Rhizobium etli]MBB4534577.1 hypothetical protein [Rhizobium etli]
MADSSVQTIGIFYFGSTLGWVVGAFLAFIVAGRHGRSALISPILLCAVVAVAFLPVPALWGSPGFLLFFGLVLGALRAVFPLASALFLVGGRPGKIDFGCALTLMSTTILISAFAPVGASWLYGLDLGAVPVVSAFWPACSSPSSCWCRPAISPSTTLRVPATSRLRRGSDRLFSLPSS